MDQWKYSYHSPERLLGLLFDEAYEMSNDNVTDSFKEMMEEIRDRLETLAAIQSAAEGF